MEWMRDVVTALLLVGGSFFCFVAALGVLRMPDTYIRMHASSKAGTLGCGLLLAAVAIHFGEVAVVSRALVTIAFVLVTAPAGAHMIGRAAHRTGVPLWSGSVVDEWQGRDAPPAQSPSNES
jgi:multicomponent Na+:H+ antiporter subunit G